MAPSTGLLHPSLHTDHLLPKRSRLTSPRPHRGGLPHQSRPTSRSRSLGHPRPSTSPGLLPRRSLIRLPSRSPGLLPQRGPRSQHTVHPLPHLSPRTSPSLPTSRSQGLPTNHRRPARSHPSTPPHQSLPNSSTPLSPRILHPPMCSPPSSRMILGHKLSLICPRSPASMSSARRT